MFYPNLPFNKHPDVVKLLHANLNTTEISPEILDFVKWLCLPPKTTTIRVNSLRTTCNQFISTIKQNISENLLPNQPEPIISSLKDLPDVVLIENLNSDWTYECETDLEIIVDSSCGSALLRGAHVYAPGVLAMPSGTKLGDKVRVYADIDGRCKKGTSVIYSSGKKCFIGLGIVCQQRHQLFGINPPSGIAIKMMMTRSCVPCLGDSYIPNGDGLLQNLPSIICGRVLNPKSGDIVLDMCACPGNKTTHLADLMCDSGKIIALDKSTKKVQILKQNIEKFHLKSVHCFVYDSTKLVTHSSNVMALDNSPPFRINSFDKILLDAPCSALGNRPQLNNDISPKMLQSYPKLQKKLFRQAVDVLKSGGTLVYSTCTVIETENEEIVRWALDEFQNIRLLPAEPLLGGSGWKTGCLIDAERIKVQRFGPRFDSLRPENHSIYDDTVGFFIAKFIKISN